MSHPVNELEHIMLLNTEQSMTVLNQPQHAPRGFTARALTCAEEGSILVKQMKLVSNHIQPHSSQFQRMCVPHLFVDENADRAAQIIVRPTTIATINNLFRRKTVDGTAGGLESMAIDTPDLTGIDPGSFTFNGGMTGKDTLELHQTVTLNQPSCYTSTLSVSTTPTDYPPGGGYLATDTDNDYGSLVLTTTIQPNISEFEMFTLVKGATAPADDVLLTLGDDDYVKFSELDQVVDSNGKFLQDFIVSPELHQIVKSFTSTHVKFHPRTKIPEGTVVSFVHSPGSGSNNFSTVTDAIPDDTRRVIVYDYATYPHFVIPLSQGFKIDSPVEILDGYSLHPGFVLPENTTFNDKAFGNTALTLTNVVAYPGSIFPVNTVIRRGVPFSHDIKVPKGFSSSYEQLLPTGSHVSEYLTIAGVTMPVGNQLPSELTTLSQLELTEEIVAAKGTLLKKGTYLPKGAPTPEGALIDSSINFPSNTELLYDLDVKTPFVVEGGATLVSGTTLRGPFILPQSTAISSGNYLPANVKVLMSAGVTLEEGMELEKGTILGGGATLYGNLGFNSKGYIPAGSSLHGTFTFPVGSTLPKGTSLPVSLPLPLLTKLDKDFLLPKGTVFSDGSNLPYISNIAEHVLTSPDAGPISRLDGENGSFIKIKGGSSLTSGFVIPKGSILSGKATPGSTTSVTLALTPDDAVEYVLDAGEYSFDHRERSAAGQDYTISPAETLANNLVLLVDIMFPGDILIPLEKIGENFLKEIIFNEPFTLVNDLKLTEEYTVFVSNSVMLPPSSTLHTDLTFTSQYTINANHMLLNKRLQFNFNTTEDFTYGVVGSTGYIKFPSPNHKLECPIKLAINQTVANSGQFATKAYIELVKGTKLKLPDASINVKGSLTLPLPIEAVDDFTITSDMTGVPRISLLNGISLKAGTNTPGDFSFSGNTGLPKNMLLPNAVVLSSDHVLNEDTYRLHLYTKLATGSVLARGTSFPTGYFFNETVTLSSFLSIDDDTTFYVNESDFFRTDFFYHYLVNESTGEMNIFHTDARNLVSQILSLTEMVKSLEMQVAAL